MEFSANRSISGRLQSDIGLDDFDVKGNECIYIN